MKKIINILSIGLMVLTFFGSVFAEDASMPSEFEWRFFHNINQARVEPLETAESLGLDAQKIIEDFPEYREILENGMPPLQFDFSLYQAAVNHTEDMILNQYYSSESPEGATPETRMKEVGYIPIEYGETLGMLLFANFLPQEDAADILFENMLKDEFDKSYTGARNILNADLKDCGISIKSGRWILGSQSYNCYLITCDFASSYEHSMEPEIVAVINQLRAVPVRFASVKFQANTEKLAKWLYRQTYGKMSLPPLIFDSRIYSATRSYILEIIEKDFFSDGTWTEGEGIEEKIANTGYPLSSYDKLISVIQTVPEIETLAAAKEILYQKILSDLNSLPLENSFFLAQNVRHISACVERTEREKDSKDSSSKSYTFLSLTMAEPVAEVLEDVNQADNQETSSEQYYLYCAAYLDKNGNGLYDMGEGLSDLNIDIYVDESHFEIPADEAGTISMPVENGKAYRILVEYSGETVEKNVRIDGENIGVWIFFNEPES